MEVELPPPKPLTTWQVALDLACRSWMGTPHVDGQQMKGVGVDCVRFVTAVLDELFFNGLPPPPRFPPDLTLYDRRKAMQVTNLIARRYPHKVIRGVPPFLWESGDVLIHRAGSPGEKHTAGAPIGQPAHIMIVGAYPGQVWHSTSAGGVHFTGVNAVAPGVVRVLRPIGRENWKPVSDSFLQKEQSNA